MGPKLCARCLVVDADPLVRWTVVHSLQTRCLDVRSIESGELAIVVLREWPVDFLIAESHLPGMDGVELAKRCQNLNCRPSTILLTDGQPPLPPRELHGLGVIGVIEKPFILDPLARLLAGVAQKEKNEEGAAT